MIHVIQLYVNHVMIHLIVLLKIHLIVNHVMIHLIVHYQHVHHHVKMEEIVLQQTYVIVLLNGMDQHVKSQYVIIVIMEYALLQMNVIVYQDGKGYNVKFQHAIVV